MRAFAPMAYFRYFHAQGISRPPAQGFSLTRRYGHYTASRCLEQWPASAPLRRYMLARCRKPGRRIYADSNITLRPITRYFRMSLVYDAPQERLDETARPTLSRLQMIYRAETACRMPRGRRQRLFYFASMPAMPAHEAYAIISLMTAIIDAFIRRRRQGGEIAQKSFLMPPARYCSPYRAR